MPIGFKSAAARRLPAVGVALAAALALCLALPSRADDRSQARDQFARAVRMRTMLEGYLVKDRSLSAYQQTVAAYHKVYLISVRADEVTPALVAEAELDEEMGRLYDPKYFQSAIDACNFLVKQYPGSSYRGEALLSIARVQKDDLDKPNDAEGTYQEYLKRFPHSQKAKQVREALKDLQNADLKDADSPATPAPTTNPANAKADVKDAAAKAVGAKPADEPPDERGAHADPRVADRGMATVKAVRTWNSENSTRVIVMLGDTIDYKSAHIASPDRIYFDLSKARLGPKPKISLDEKAGLLKSVRIAPNRPGVVRLVLDVDGAKDYSAFLLAKPYRLIIDVRAQGTETAKDAAAPRAKPPATAKSFDADNGPASGAPTAAAERVAVISEPYPKAAAPDTEPPLPKPAAKLVTQTDLPAKKLTAKRKEVALLPPTEPKPTHDGQRSLTRALGLKISRIVIDAGHGGRDTGTIGPHGLMEKDVCLDVALRLGTLIEEKLPGAQVVYTRKDDTYVSLEERTAIANQAHADLFISIHANSSNDPQARGIETYYLNFATSTESMEVATRENATSEESLHNLQDLIQKIARNEKIEESKELAGDIQDTLSQRLRLVSHQERNRGVKKAPFVVLIGANMPSVLSEISFVSNPNDERLLRKPDQRQRIADGLYRGISAYLENLNSLASNKQKLVSDNHSSEVVSKQDQ
ncbi:MAG TPA: N-acetylmuramoyl-L-alanine amidase [Candidatus Acidoferrales bacterium]|nr:N-acetylmuramoyl-L-alanine amidase [Candidatus Acidoferrales bacterium]